MAYLKSMKELTDKLLAIGALISEEDQVVTLLGNLPQSYSMLVTALEAHVTSRWATFSRNFSQERKKNEDPGKCLSQS